MTHLTRTTTARRLIGLAVAAIAVLASSCADGSAPSGVSRLQSPDAALAAAKGAAATLPNGFVAQGLLRTSPLPADIQVSKEIHNGGGTIEVSGADFQLKIPKGAFVGESMTITVTARAGYTVAYDFEPHGTVFLAPLTFVQHVSHTNLAHVKATAGFIQQLSGAYYPSGSLLDPVTGLAVVTELFPADITLHGDELSFPIHHFSGYMIATGREEY